VVQAIYIQMPKKVGQISLDIFWIKNTSLADLDNIPDQDVLAGKTIDHLETVMESFCDL
jgi:type I restriction enzyme M protein